jgi:signal transduction histidine kinase
MSDFLLLMSHEVRTPLTSIKGYGQLVQLRLQRLASEVVREQFSPEQLAHRLTELQQSLELVESPLRRLNRLLEDLGEVAQIQSGRLQLSRVPCDLGKLLWEATREQQLAWPHRNLDLRLPDQRVVVLADPDRIGQAVTNYLTNALKYAPADRPIGVSLGLEADQAWVEVHDQGAALPPAEQERIWQRFYRLPGTQVEHQVGGNLGMGLYICRSIIALHGGQTGVESAPGAGNTFWFTLPLEQAADG